LTIGVKDMEAALTRPEPEAGIVPAGLPRVPSGYSRRHQSVIREGTKLVRVGLQEYGIRSWTSSHGRLVPADIAILGSGPQVLRELTRLCQSAMDGDLQRRITERAARAREIHTAIATRGRRDLKERWRAQKPISTGRRAAEIFETIRGLHRVLLQWTCSDGGRP